MPVVAPDLDHTAIGNNDHMQDDLSLDSMGFLNLVSALQKRFGLPIPEVDYPRLQTTAKAVAYLEDSLGRLNDVSMACPHPVVRFQS